MRTKSLFAVNNIRYLRLVVHALVQPGLVSTQGNFALGIEITNVSVNNVPNVQGS